MISSCYWSFSSTLGERPLHFMNFMFVFKDLHISWPVCLSSWVNDLLPSILLHMLIRDPSTTLLWST